MFSFQGIKILPLMNCSLIFNQKLFFFYFTSINEPYEKEFCVKNKYFSSRFMKKERCFANFQSVQKWSQKKGVM